MYSDIAWAHHALCVQPFNRWLSWMFFFKDRHPHGQNRALSLTLYNFQLDLRDTFWIDLDLQFLDQLAAIHNKLRPQDPLMVFKEAVVNGLKASIKGDPELIERLQSEFGTPLFYSFDIRAMTERVTPIVRDIVLRLKYWRDNIEFVRWRIYPQSELPKYAERTILSALSETIDRAKKEYWRVFLILQPYICDL